MGTDDGLVTLDQYTVYIDGTCLYDLLLFLFLFVTVTVSVNVQLLLFMLLFAMMVVVQVRGGVVVVA